MAKRTSKWFILIPGAVAVGTIVAFGLWASDRSPSNEDISSDADWGGATSLPILIENSSVIVRATFQSERLETRELRSPVTGQVAAERTELVRQFKLNEALRGDLPPSATFEVRTTTTIKTWERERSSARTWTIKPPQLGHGEEYVLFLTKFSEETGEDLGFAGVVATARLEGQELTFVAPAAYLTELAQTRMDDRGKTGLGASFDENIGRVRELVLALPYRPGGAHTDSAKIDSQTENGRLVQSLVARADEFADGKAIESHLREIGFSPTSLEPPACYKLEALFQEKGKTVELGC